jgi:hypothetical protein
MAINIEAIIWYLFLLDSVGAVIASWCCAKRLNKTFKKLFKHLPLTKGWALIYLGLVLWVGYTLYRLGILPY